MGQPVYEQNRLSEQYKITYVARCRLRHAEKAASNVPKKKKDETGLAKFKRMLAEEERELRAEYPEYRGEHVRSGYADGS